MEAVGRLAGGVAHDFNNLLTVIGGYSALLLKTLRPDDPVVQDLREIAGAAERAAALTRQLLAFSRKQVLQPRIVDLNETVLSMRRMLERLIGEDLEFVTELDPALGRVWVDPGQIEQVIANLAVNARDAMPDGGRLVIASRNAPDPWPVDHGGGDDRATSFAVLEVRDTGVGMDAETMSHIFEPFFTTKERGKGTGLGLSTVYGIVKQSGGLIKVQSEPGNGTTFSIFLPSAENQIEAVEAAAPDGDADGGCEIVLVVEDQADVRQFVCRTLERLGYEVLVAENAGEALLICEQHEGPIDLLLTDVVMPRMSGPQLVARLSTVRPGLKTLFISGYPEDTLVNSGALEGSIALVNKPFTPGEIGRRVRQVLDT
jgi:CheY-like chemotaxis protein